MNLLGLKNAFVALVKSNGIVVIAVFIIVIHGFTTKFLAWLNRKAKKDDDDDEQESVEDKEVAMIPYKPETFSKDEMIKRSKDFYEEMNKRRSVRFFSDKKVPFEVIENCIKTAGTSPSGAHKQPWTYVVVQDPDYKEKLRRIVETEEEINYKRRMSQTWLNDLKKLRTTYEKPYLSTAPYIILVFKQTFNLSEEGKRETNYYNEISCNISCGLLLAAIQKAGLVTLTSTPMNAGPLIKHLFKRGKNEKLQLLLPVGYAADDCEVPDLKRKALEDIMVVV